MIKTKVLVLLCSFCCFFLCAQVNTNDEQTLISILKNIEKEKDYVFSYADDLIREIEISPPSLENSIQEILSELENKTGFRFKILRDKTITISSEKVEVYCITFYDESNDIFAVKEILINGSLYKTNQEGNIKINLENKGKIVIDVPGFESEIWKPSPKDISKENCAKIILRPKIEKLNTVILNDYLVKGIAKAPDGSIEIDYNDFGILPGFIEPDLLFTLQSLPGILSVDETVSNINVRGGTNDQNLILWDGIKMYQSSHFFGLISAFNPYLTNTVQLYKNGSSPVYGDGVSSVIAMETSSKLQKKITASVGTNMISTDAYVDTPLGNKSSIQIALRRSLNDIVETPTYDSFFDKAFQNSELDNSSNTDTRFSFYDASARWMYEISEKDLIKTNIILLSNQLTFTENDELQDILTSRESNVEQRSVVGGIYYQRKWSSLITSEIQVYGTNYDLNSINSDIQSDQRLLQENDVLESGLKTTVSYQKSDKIRYINGYQFNETGISNLRDVTNPTFRERIKDVIRTHSVFSELEWKSEEYDARLDIGYRISYFEKFNKFSFEPRLNFYKRFKNHFTIEFAGELKSQTTMQIIDFQTDFLGIENRRWVLSNDQDIPILRSWQTSGGLSYNHNNWLIDLNIYYKNVDGIISRSQGFQNQFEFARAQGSYKTYGIDFLINKRFKNFSSWLSYSLADNDYNFESLHSEEFPNNIDIRHNINLAFAYIYDKLKLSAGLNWHTGKPTTAPTNDPILSDGNIAYEAPNSSRLKDYFRVDASANYNFKLSNKIRAFAGLSFWNVFDRKNISNQFFRPHSGQNVEEVNQLGLRFTPNLVFRINF